jgi:hypothetical protein
MEEEITGCLKICEFRIQSLVRKDPVEVEKYLEKKIALPEEDISTLILFNTYRVSQKWRTNGALRCRRDYRKRQKNVKKILLDLFSDLAVFECGT